MPKLMFLFRPSLSKREGLHRVHYEAEQLGQKSMCEYVYKEKCPNGIFDLISFMK